MRIIEDQKLDFDNVLICPKRSEEASRANVVLERSYSFKYSKSRWTGVPIIAANMDTVGTLGMHNALSSEKMCTALHKFYSIDRLIDFFKVPRPYAFYTIGIREEDLEKLKNVYYETGNIDNICIDVANGYSKHFVEHTNKVRSIFPDAIIMAGNVCTPEMTQELIINGGVDIVKIGIGPGSVCSTRTVTGVGYPQLSAIIECSDVAHGLKAHICGDGGCRATGDINKAFGAGADFVMLGGMFSGHDECEGEWQYGTDENGYSVRTGLKFYGMSSETANEKYSGGLKNYRASEGNEVVVPYRGPVCETLRKITGGLRSCCSLVGASSLKDLSKCTTFIKVSKTHDNY